MSDELAFLKTIDPVPVATTSVAWSMSTGPDRFKFPSKVTVEPTLAWVRLLKVKLPAAIARFTGPDVRVPKAPVIVRSPVPDLVSRLFTMALLTVPTENAAALSIVPPPAASESVFEIEATDAPACKIPPPNVINWVPSAVALLICTMPPESVAPPLKEFAELSTRVPAFVFANVMPVITPPERVVVPLAESTSRLPGETPPAARTIPPAVEMVALSLVEKFVRAFPLAGLAQLISAVFHVAPSVPAQVRFLVAAEMEVPVKAKSLAAVLMMPMRPPVPPVTTMRQRIVAGPATTSGVAASPALNAVAALVAVGVGTVKVEPVWVKVAPPSVLKKRPAEVGPTEVRTRLRPLMPL